MGNNEISKDMAATRKKGDLKYTIEFARKKYGRKVNQHKI